MDTVYTRVWSNGLFDLISKDRVALQYGQGGTKEEQTTSLYLLYSWTPTDALVEQKTNVPFEDALIWVATGELP